MIIIKQINIIIYNEANLFFSLFESVVFIMEISFKDEFVKKIKLFFTVNFFEAVEEKFLLIMFFSIK